MTSPPKVRVAAVAAVVTVAVITSGLSYDLHRRVLKKERAHQSGQINDFERWMVLVPQFVDHHVDYESDTFPNPPVTLAFLYPLTSLAPARAQVLWAWCKALMGTTIFLLCLAMVRTAGVRLTVTVGWLIFGTWIWPLVGDVQAGQTNLLMLLPLVAGLSLAQTETRTRDWLAGLLIALAICIKVTPIIFLPYMLFRRRWLLALAIVLGMVVWLLVVPGILFGWEQNLRWLRQWSSIMIAPYVVHGHVEYATGQSLPSLITRLLRHVPAYVSGQGGMPRPRYVNVADLPEAVVNWLIRGVLLAIGLAGALWARHPLTTFRSRRYVMEIGCVAAFMLWASQRTWTEHYVSLVITLCAVGMLLSDSTQTETTRRRAWWALVVSGSLMVWTSDLAKLVAADGGHYVRTLGVPFWTSVALVLVLVTARGAETSGGGRRTPPRPIGLAARAG